MVSAKLLLILLTATAATAQWPQQRMQIQPELYTFDRPTTATVQDDSLQQDVFKSGGTYILLGDNGKYLSRIKRSYDYIEAEKVSIDRHCLYRASVLGNGKVALKADDGNHDYLSQYTTPDGASNILAKTTSIDVYSEFAVEVSTPGPWNGARYVHLKANNGKYWGIVVRSGRNNIEAAFDGKTEATRLIVLEAQ